MSQRRFSLQVPISMGVEPGTSGKIKVDEHYPSELDEPPPFDVKKIENIRSNVKFDTLYHISKQIGDGKFGKVYRVIEKTTGQEFAAKFIKIRKEADRAEVEREVSILTQLRHPRIAQIFDAFYTTTNDVVLIMEIVRGGELFDRVAEETYVLSELAVVMIICQLCEAIDYIHQQNILHLDVKPENIMCVSLTGNRIKLIDFGLARHYDGTQELKYMAGTPEFAAPEVIKFEKLDFHTDMWSVGVITYILLSGYSPFLGENLGETYCNVERGVWEFTEEFDAVSAEAKDFVSKLLIYDQHKRMLPHECLKHPWIAVHRQKAQCNATLEKPLGAPPIDNKQMMRYNAKRKFRRMIIYVKFLIEMNRLRNSLRTRMSANGHKFFDPLLRMAEKKEKRIAAVCNSSSLKPAEKAVENVENVGKRDQPIVKYEKRASLAKIEEEVLVGEEKKKKKKSLLKPSESDGQSDAKKTTTVRSIVTTQESTESPKKKKKVVVVEKADHEEATKKSTTVDAKPPMAPAAKSELEKIAETEMKVLKKKKMSVTSIHSEPNHIEVLPVIPEKSTRRVSLSDDEKKKVVVVKRKKLTDSKKSVDDNSPTQTLSPPKLPKKMASSAESVVDRPPPLPSKPPPSEVKLLDVQENGKTPLVNKPPMPPAETKRASLSEKKMNAAENNCDVVADKKPTRQGALRKKEKSDEVLNNPVAPAGLTTTGRSRTLTETSGTSSAVDVITSDGHKKTIEKVVTKKRVSSSKDPSPARVSIGDVDSNSTGTKSTTQVVGFEKKKDSIPTATTARTHPEVPPTDVLTTDSIKRSKTLTLTPEKKTTTTTSTTTSVKRKTESSEKKVQHSSEGKSVEEQENKKSQSDNVKISQVITKREESPEQPRAQTSVKKKVLKTDTLKATTEKNRSEAENKDEKQVVRTTATVTGKFVDKLTVEHNSQMNGGAVSSLKLAGVKTVTKKAEVKLETEVGAQKVAINKVQAQLSEEVTKQLNSESNGKTNSVKRSSIIKVKLSPDLTSDSSSDKSGKSNNTLKSSVRIQPKMLTRDNSEERKKVRFAGFEEEKKPQPLFGPGLQKMKSESCLPSKMLDMVNKQNRTKDDDQLRKQDIRSESVDDYVPRDDFNFDSLREMLNRRLSDVPDVSDGTRRSPVHIPPTNSVKDRLKMFEKLKR